MFTKQEADWGFTLFMPLAELLAPGAGFIVGDAIIFKARRGAGVWILRTCCCCCYSHCRSSKPCLLVHSLRI